MQLESAKSPRFLNVDLEIESSAKLDSLAAEMGARRDR